MDSGAPQPATTPAFDGLACAECGARADLIAGDGRPATRCVSCGGVLAPAYDAEVVNLPDAIDAAADADPAATADATADTDTDTAGTAGGPARTMWEYDDLLPVPRVEAVTMGEGGTPLCSCPALAEELGVGELYVKDEGQNPTGTVADREASVALSVARAAHASDVVVPSTGDDGQAVAAYAARAGLDAHVFVPSRSGFVRKAMVNVHGADMTVVGGRYDDAVEAAEAARADEQWVDCSPFAAPGRLDGAKSVLIEVLAALSWSVPDAVILPTSSGIGLVAAHLAATQLRANGVVDELPPLYAAQPSGCAPIVAAHDAGAEHHEPVERPDTIAGELEDPNPAGAALALRAIRESGGGAIATEDDDVLAAGGAVASRSGLELGVAGATAASGAWALAERDELGSGDSVVVVNTGAGNKDADVLRSYLMGQGV